MKYFILIFLFISACNVKIHLPEGENVSTQQAEQQLAALNSTYPDSFILTQRIVLTVGGKQYDFIGTLKMQSDTAFHMVAVGEMGGIFLEMRYANGRVELLKNPSDLPENPLKEGVIGDIKLLYNQVLKMRIVDSRQRNEELFIKIEKHDSESRLLTFRNSNLSYVEQIVMGRIKRIVKFNNFKKIDGYTQELPMRILLENKIWHYSLKIDFLKINVLEN